MIPGELIYEANQMENLLGKVKSLKPTMSLWLVIYELVRF